MLGAVRATGARFGCEHSVKMGRNALADRRFLLSLPLCALGADIRTGFADICARIGAPAGAVSALKPHLGAAAHLHLGYEGAATHDTLKVYLEFSAPPIGDRDLVFLAAKWRSRGAAWRITRYRRAPATDLDALIAANAPAGCRNAVRALAAMTLEGGAAPRALIVADDGGSRRSLDLNLYDAALRLDRCAAPLKTLFAAFGHDGARFVRAHADRVLGHVAIGATAPGSGFATIYFGAAEGV